MEKVLLSESKRSLISFGYTDGKSVGVTFLVIEIEKTLVLGFL